MKIYANQLVLSLKKGLTPIYLISGDIPALCQEASKTIHSHAKEQGFSETFRYQVDTNFHWNELENVLEHFSLFQEKQYIELQLIHFPVSTKGGELLKHYAQNPQDNKILVLVTPKLDVRTQKTPWVKQVIDTGTYIPIWPMAFGQYTQWLRSKLQAKDLHIEEAGIRLLADYSEGNYAHAMQTVEKLNLVYGTAEARHTLSVEEIASLVMPGYQYDLFDWVEACLLGQTDKMIQRYETLKRAHTEPALMLWAITQDIRKLIHLQFYKRQHAQLVSDVFKRHGVWEKKQSSYQKALNRHSLERLESLLEVAHQTDKLLKGAKVGNVWEGLMDIGLRLALQNFSH